MTTHTPKILYIDDEQMALKYFKRICNEWDVLTAESVATALEILKKVGFSVSPRDANHEIRKIVDHICKNSGGNGAFRELCDLIVTRKFGNKKKLY